MIPARPDLLVIGGMTIDHFADGRTAPGGSVLHVARAAAPRGMRVAVVTVVGPEPQAQSALAELRQLAAVESVAAVRTATFLHRELDGGRRLRLDVPPEPIHLAGFLPLPAARAVLAAPIADELGGPELSLLVGPWTRGAILQGWLRSIGRDGATLPREVRAVEPPVRAALSEFDVLIVSREDLAAESSDATAQLDALRSGFGDQPVLVLTDGSAGAWVEVAGARLRLPMPRVVDGVSTVGAGDILAAYLLAASWPRPASLGFVRSRAEQAMQAVAEVLEERKARA
ncbi:MAG: PfkB family carbohydrate kinase [Candidatus Limnocylindria bacterium]